jgi:hypothetical protein
MGLGDRVRRLEERKRQSVSYRIVYDYEGGGGYKRVPYTQEDAARSRRALHRLYRLQENWRREQDGRELLPEPPRTKEDEDDDRHTLAHEIPEMRRIWARAGGGQLTDDEREFLDGWECEVSERLSGTEPTKGAER